MNYAETVLIVIALLALAIPLVGIRIAAHRFA